MISSLITSVCISSESRSDFFSESPWKVSFSFSILPSVLIWTSQSIPSVCRLSVPESLPFIDSTEDLWLETLVTGNDGTNSSVGSANTPMLRSKAFVSDASKWVLSSLTFLLSDSCLPRSPDISKVTTWIFLSKSSDRDFSSSSSDSVKLCCLECKLPVWDSLSATEVFSFSWFCIKI